MNYADLHLNTYNRTDVVENYVKESGLHACEAYLFDKYVKSGDAILDLGVGGGRTTPYLSDKGARYVGVDYSQSMVEACRRKFPALAFYCENACDLRRFEDASFDVVMFSYCGMDCIGTLKARETCLREALRVLKRGGRFIFSSHNAKQLGWCPRLHDASSFRKILRIFESLAYRSPRQCVTRLASQAFWKGFGYVDTIAEGEWRPTFVSTPNFFEKMAHEVGFAYAEVCSNLHPRRVPKYWLEWYNYVLVKP